jgi:alkanesulfonate monooxygenase SsuD/methylene tetrahydromethanopterin reductase-like flavin-dependent oxidoreductase (luciferase family)
MQQLDGSLLIEYQNALDPLDVLTYVVSNTNKIILGTSVIDMFFYTPIMLAKRFATLDLLSQGRSICDLVLVGQRTSIKLLIFHLKAEEKERMNLFKH